MLKYGQITNNIHSTMKDREKSHGKDISYRSMAREMQVSTTSLLKAIHNPEHNLTLGLLTKICWFLNCQPGDLITYIPPAEEKQ